MNTPKIVCAVGLLGALLWGPPAAWSQEYRIGFIAAITGPASSLGVPERDVAVMIQKELDAKSGIAGRDGKKRPVKIIIHDDQSKPDETVKAVKKLIADDKVHVVIASSQSPTSLAVVPIVTEAKAPLISMASSHAIVTPVRDRHWVFKTPQSNIHVAVHQINYLKAKKIKKVASLYVNDAFGEDSRRGLAELAKGAGIEIVYEDKFEHADKDMTPQLTKVRGSGAEVLIVHAIPPAASIITKNVRDLRLTIPLIHNHGVGTKPFIDLAGGAAEGVIFPIGKMLVAEGLPDADPQKKVLLDFIAWYEKGTGKPRSTFAGHAWDALQMLFPILASLPADLTLEAARGRIRDELEKTRNFVGTGGIFNMSAEDHVGLDERSMVLVRIEEGKWKYFPREKW
ncbi:MAG: ABC transporter substrate-binding protein [Candidatus Rokubacteria bacterium]|nr:ABC transporter substrate-binding protein [Candidatus Rokubacteria bacterium]